MTSSPLRPVPPGPILSPTSGVGSPAHSPEDRMTPPMPRPGTPLCSLLLVPALLLPLPACDAGSDVPDVPGVADGIRLVDDVPYRSGYTDA